MSREDHIEVEGVIRKQFTSENFEVEIPSKTGSHIVRAHRAGKLRFIRLTPGDKGLVWLSPYEPTKGIIRHTIK